MAAKKNITPAPKTTARTSKAAAPRNEKPAPAQAPAPAPQTGTKTKTATKPARQPRVTSRDAAHRVLSAGKRPMTPAEIVAAMTKAGLFTGKNDQTAEVNICYRMRNDADKRFTKTDDGKWTAK